MKRVYTKPKAKMVNFQYTERVVASGDVGTRYSGANIGYCQFAKAGCRGVYSSTPVVCHSTDFPSNPGLPGPTI